MKEYSLASLLTEALQSHLLTLQIREISGASTPTAGEQILPWIGL